MIDNKTGDNLSPENLICSSLQEETQLPLATVDQNFWQKCCNQNVKGLLELDLAGAPARNPNCPLWQQSVESVATKMSLYSGNIAMA